ncbi:ER degradation-enhancing alpha-mannosidase-like protein 1 [Aspergillus udagawae]|nr:ER degradation-enhancing alpha-mannosidase-like protein 1 [Aspergillus udagawae]
MDPPRVSTTQQTKPSQSSLNSTFHQNGSNRTISYLQNESQGPEYGAGRLDPHTPGESAAPGDSGLNATVSPDTPPVPHIQVNLPRPADNSDSNGEWPSDARLTRETQTERSRREAARSGQQRRSCMPALRDRSIRRRLYTLIPATIFLLAIIAFYLAIHSATHLGQEIHILLIFMILILSIIFCHALIRFAMEILQDPRSTVASNRIPSRVGPMGYAQPDRPIQVTLAGDEEALVYGTVREKVTAPPPAYGLWRSSVRINPDLLYWRRLEDDELPPAAINGMEMRSNRKPPAPRPPSYTSDDGVDYVIQAQPRLFTTRHDTEDPARQ